MSRFFAALAVICLLSLVPHARGQDAGAPPADPEVRRILGEVNDVVKDAAARFKRKYFSEAVNPDGSAGKAEEGAGPATPSESVAKARSLIERLRVRDPERAAKLAAIVDQLDANWKTMITDETKCRAAPKCMADRLLPEVCTPIVQKRELLEAIRTEKQNPGGVVNLKNLHDWGEQIQMLEPDIKAAKARYAKVARKPLADAQCAKFKLETAEE